MNPLQLRGCTPEPLMGYLKALGLFRLLGEQRDPRAALSWVNGSACLNTSLERSDVIRFLVEEYAPTPILAPWNGGSGFYGGASQPVLDLEQSTVPRLSAYRAAIRALRAIVPREKPKDDDKQHLLETCRAVLADEVIPWLDACYVLGEENCRFFPLFGTGGNDGRLEFTNTFMQRLKDVCAFDLTRPTPADSWELAESALFADRLVSLRNMAVGQFNPGGIGGPNATQGDFEGGSQVNAWDYILMLEGALLFAGSLGRRLNQQGGGRAVFPFSVDSVAVGYGSATATEETSDGSRAEFWLPLWNVPMTLPETRHLLAEGRAQLGRRQARNSVEFALAINLLGVSRGLSAFVRYGFLKRNGLAFLATPLGTVPVQARPHSRLLQEPNLTDWLDAWRRAASDKDRVPGRYQGALRDIDRAMFRFAARSEQGNDADWLIPVLRSLGKAEQTLATGQRFAKDKRLRPLQRMPSDWLAQADDGSVEFRLAAALAGTQGLRGVVPSIRAYLEPVEATGDSAKWSPGSASAVWTTRGLAENLASVFLRRQMEADRSGSRGTGVPLYSPRPAAIQDVLRFLLGQTDDDKLADLLWGFSTLQWSAVDFQSPQPLPCDQLPLEFAALRVLVSPIRPKTESVTATGMPPLADLPTDRLVFQLLASGQTDCISRSTTRAAQRLRAAGCTVVGYRNRHRAGRPLDPRTITNPTRLLASMLFPLSTFDLCDLADSILFDPQIQE